MGHSFCSGPSLPRDLKTSFATPKQSTKRTPRSSGYPALRPLSGDDFDSFDDFTDSRNLLEVKDLLQQNPSSLIRTDTNRRKRIADLFAKPGQLSSKQVKQMLLSRRSLSSHLSTSSYPRSLAKDVEQRTTKDGKNYFQIATSSRMYECGNPSVYQVNHRQTVSGIEAPLRSFENMDPTYLGIPDEYPHLISNDGESKQPRDAEISKDTESFLPPKPSQYPKTLLDHSESSKNLLPVIKDIGGLAERQTSPVAKARIYGPQINHSPSRVETRKLRDHPVNREIKYRSPLALPAPSTSQLPRTPRSSVEEARSAAQASPTRNIYSKPPSIQSVTNSVVDDAQSEASIGVVSMAQSAEFVRAGYHNSGVHKFPKPGPAPTGALPSLPEGLDLKTNILYLPSVESTPGHTHQTSPTRAILISPAKKKNRYRPLDDAVNEDTARLLRTQTRSRPKRSSQSRTSAQSPKLSADEPCGNASTPENTARRDERFTESWRETRARSRKALKLRDLDHLRVQADNVRESAIAGAQSNETPPKAVKMRESYSSPALLPGYLPNTRRSSTPDLASHPHEAVSRPYSQISPICVLAEHEPVQHLPQYRNSNSVTLGSIPTIPSKCFPSPTLPSLPSSDEDSTKRPTTLPANSTGSSRRSAKPGPNPAPQSHPQAYAAELSDLEFRLSARITELEKKNAMLLNAFVAVINTSAGLAGSEQTSVSLSPNGLGSAGGYRSSGLSSGSGMRSSGTSGGELKKVQEGFGDGAEKVNGNG
ncbi:MAG: hypothetical protein Q9195_007256 [Heterodermia aff. obscurata]